MTKEEVVNTAFVALCKGCDTYQLIENIFEVAYRMGYRDSLVDKETNRNRFEEDELESVSVVH